MQSLQWADMLLLAWCTQEPGADQRLACSACLHEHEHPFPPHCLSCGGQLTTDVAEGLQLPGAAGEDSEPAGDHWKLLMAEDSEV